VMIDTDTIIGSLHVEAHGGDGGNTLGRLYCFGAGGSGSGGRVGFTNTTPMATTITDVRSGVAGLASVRGQSGVVSPCESMHDGAQGGTGHLAMQRYSEQPMHERRASVASVLVNPISPGDIASIIHGSDTLLTQPLDKSTWIKLQLRSADGCAYADSVHVHVRRTPGKRPRIFLSVNDASGRPGENVHIVVRAYTYDTLAQPVNLRGRLTSRASLLVPNTLTAEYSKRLSSVAFILSLGEPASTSESISYRCVLGDADTSELVLDSVHADEADVVVERRGVFRLTGVCVAGGRSRLFDPWGGVISIERVDDVTFRINTSAVVIGAFDMVGKRLDAALSYETGVTALSNERGTTVLSLKTKPARELYLTLMAHGMPRTMVLWLR